MKIKIKTLKGGTFQLDDVEASATVADIKKRISDEKGFESELIKLIHAGKVLADATTVEAAKIKEGGFIVCMVSKAKKKPAAAAAPAAADTAVPAAAAAPASTPAAPANAPAAAAATPSGGAASSTTQPAAPAETPGAAPAAVPVAPAAPQSSAGDAAKVEQLKEMGFPEEECRRALAAAFGNADRAVEYLMTGIPDGVEASMMAASPPAASVPAAAAPATAESSPAAAPTSSTTAPATSDGPLSRLRSHPQFDDLRRAIQANPAMLQPVLQQLAAQDPELMTAIDANRQSFIDLMNEPVAAAPAPGGNLFAGAPGGGGMGGAGGAAELQQIIQMMQNMPAEERAAMAAQLGIPLQQLEQFQQLIQQNPAMLQQMMGGMMAGAGGGMPGGAPQQNVIRLTPEELAAVERLAELGFPKRACVEAYFACDKNEELAANYLFQNPPDSMEEG